MRVLIQTHMHTQAMDNLPFNLGSEEDGRPSLEEAYEEQLANIGA